MNENNEALKNEIEPKIIEQVDKKITELLNAGIQQTNIDYVGKLIDIKKDLKEMEDKNMYRGYYGTYDDDYRNYRGGRSRDSRGRFMEGSRGSYGRRYRGHDMLDDMNVNYGEYMENRENGNYGSPEMNKSFDYMLQSAEDFFKHLRNEAGSEEEMEKIRKTARRISEM